MPIINDDTNEFEERATLTQRRQMGTSGASKLNRAKMEPVKTMPADETTGSSQTGKIVIWVVAVLTVAAAAYFGIKSFVSKPATVAPTPTVAPTEVVPTLTVAEQIMSNIVRTDDQADTPTSAAGAYNTTNQQVGKASTAEYTLTDLSIQKYATFTRFSFTLSGVATTPLVTGTVEPFPVITATYNKTTNSIAVLFTQISENLTYFTTADEVSVGTPAVSKFLYDTTIAPELGQEKYTIELNSQAKYSMQAVTAHNLLIVDVADVKPISTTEPTATPSVTTTLAAVTPTVAPTTSVITTPTVAPTTVTGNSTTFSKGDQTITTSLTSNTFSMIGGYKYGYPFTSSATGETYTGMFTYEKTLVNTTVPNVSASLVGTTLTIQIKNYVVSNSAAQTITFSSNGIVTSLNASVTDHVLTYVFTLVKETNYRIVFDTDHLVLHIQMQS